MGAWEIVLIVVCALIVVGVAISLIVKKLKGKPITCDCDCCDGYCEHCSKCVQKIKSRKIKYNI